MIYPSNFEVKIGFDKIRQLLSDSCISSMGREWVDKLKFSSNYNNLNIWLSQVDEMKVILLTEPSFPTYDYFDLRPALVEIKRPGNFISQEDLFDFATSIKIMNQILKILDSRAGKSDEVRQVAESLRTSPELMIRINQIIDDKGEIKDHASDELYEIRTKLRKLMRNNDSIIRENLALAINSGWTSPDTEAAMRNGRVVIPLFATFKRKISGFIHGESSTGQTVFVEPAQLFEINNEIIELEAAESRAIIKILTDLANFLRPDVDALIHAFVQLGLLDFIIAKARIAVDIEAIKPDLQQKCHIDWQGARHPLLYISHRLQNKIIVPLDIQVNEKQRILIISGPNAGGKSVSLKTVGLLQYMLQCGMLIPVKPTSVAGIFQHFFIDIGDEQSIENDLSTYSSHLLNMKYFVQNANKKTLFLIDEFGSGTEPNLGGAIAEAILEELNSKMCYGIVTTHFANLKLLPSPENGMANAAMLFNTKELEPLYVLKTGRPGSSFTVEIARKIGFPEGILKKIEKKADRRQLDFEEQLQQLDVEKKELDMLKKHVELQDNLLTDTISKYQLLYNRLQTEKSKILQDANTKATQILQNSNRIIEQTIKEIKENQAQNKKTSEARKKLEEEKKKLIADQKAEKQFDIHKKVNEELKAIAQPNNDEEKPAELKAGEYVKVKGQISIGRLDEIKGNKGVIVFDNITLSIPLEQLEYVSKTKARESERKSLTNYNKISLELHEKAANFKLKIDVRGLRVEEVLAKIQLFIDEAILLRIYEVQILHGKGTGVLRQAIRDYLSGIPEVASYQDEHVERGGHGITLVSFSF